MLIEWKSESITYGLTSEMGSQKQKQNLGGYISVRGGYILFHGDYILVHGGYIPVHGGYI